MARYSHPGAEDVNVYPEFQVVTGRDRRALVALLPALLVTACGPTVIVSDAAPSPPASLAPAPSREGPIRLLIDSDMAADDIGAIASLLREPSVEVVGITVAGTGEAHCPGGLYSARALVTALASGPIPVACGRGAALGPAQAFPEEWRTGADAGYGINLPAPAMPPDSRSAAQLIVDLASAGDRPLTILTIGPLTNLAMALLLDPALPGRIDRVVAMAGAVGVPGNVAPPEGEAGPPTAEWNLHADPTAAAEVFAAGLDLTLVPLDATNDVPLDADFISELEVDHVAAPADIVFELYARNSFLVTGEPMLWDSIAAMTLLHPEVVSVREARVRVVQGDGLDGGRTIQDPAGARVVAATGADPVLFRKLLFAALRRGAPRPDPFTATVIIRVQAGASTCEARIEPPAPRAGIVRLDGVGLPDAEVQITAFALGEWTWAELEAFAAQPVFGENTRPIETIATVGLKPGTAGTAYGEGAAGPFGVACLTGTFEAPVIRLTGPFQMAP